MKQLSVLLPVRDEKENLPILLSQLREVVGQNKNYEIIIVDDGSHDGSSEVAKQELKRNHLSGKVIELIAAFGKGAALDAGIKEASGEIIIMMDADLQDDPGEINRFLEKISEGYDGVIGWRKERKDSFYSNFSSKVFNYFSSIFTGVRLHDINCGLKVFKKKALANIRIYKGLYRFIPVFVVWKQFRVTELVVHHHQRKYGKSKYTVFKFFDGFFDLFLVTFLVRFAINPFRIYGLLGSSIFGLGFLMATYLSILRLMGETIGRRPLLIFAAIFLIGGLQLVSLGFLGELIRMNNKDEKTYFVKTITSF